VKAQRELLKKFEAGSVFSTPAFRDDPRASAPSELMHGRVELYPRFLQVKEIRARRASADDRPSPLCFWVVPWVPRALGLHALFDDEFVAKLQHGTSSLVRRLCPGGELRERA
jgi:hypothetical protein